MKRLVFDVMKIPSFKRLIGISRLIVEVLNDQNLFTESNLDTVFPRINARGVYFKIRDFRGTFIRGGRLFQNFKNSGNRIWTYKNKKTFMPCDQCYLHCDMLTNYSYTYKN